MVRASDAKLNEIREAAIKSIRHLATLTKEEKAEWRERRKVEKSDAAKARYKVKRTAVLKARAEAKEAEEAQKKEEALSAAETECADE